VQRLTLPAKYDVCLLCRQNMATRKDAWLGSDTEPARKKLKLDEFGTKPFSQMPHRLYTKFPDKESAFDRSMSVFELVTRVSESILPSTTSEKEKWELYIVPFLKSLLNDLRQNDTWPGWPAYDVKGDKVRLTPQITTLTC